LDSALIGILAVYFVPFPAYLACVFPPFWVIPRFCVYRLYGIWIIRSALPRRGDDVISEFRVGLVSGLFVRKPYTAMREILRPLLAFSGAKFLGA
jgi:hypothetical protein